LETPGSMASAAPSRLAAVPRRTGPRRPVTGPAATRTASGGTGPRAATLAPTSPAHVPAGQRANIPGIYLCLRGGPGPGWAARRGARLVAGPFPRGLPPEPRWRLSTHVALWDLRRAVGGCPWIASWQARQTIRVLRRICAVFAAQAGCPGAGVAELGDYRHRPAPVEQADDVLGSKVRRVHRILVGHSASTWSNVLTLRLRVAPARPLRNCCSVRSSSDTTLKVTVFEVVMSSLLIRGAGRVSAPDVEFSHGHRNCRGQEGDVIGSTSGRPPARWSNTAARCTTATPVPAVARARKRC
jgi:hypothetical protein